MAGNVLYKLDTAYGHYEVVDTIYNQRPARVLYSGDHLAAQSGIALDERPELLFDYNQRFLELVQGLRPERLLLIGGGAYTLPMALRQALPALQIDIVELDDALVQVAKRYFRFYPDQKMRIFHGDGRRYLDTTKQTYDVILLDAFTHTTIPESLLEPTVIKRIFDLLTPQGVAALNIIASYYGRRGSVLWRVFDDYQACFKDVKLFPAGRDLSLWIAQNFVVTGQKDPALELEAYLRFEPLKPLEV